jgi:cytochrome P450 family 135
MGGTTTAPAAAAAVRPAGGVEAPPPGLRMPPILQTLAWGLAPTWLMGHCARRFGDTFTLRFVPGDLRLVVFSDPQAVKTLFSAPDDVAPKEMGLSPMTPVMGPNSILVLTGEGHMRQRKLLLPAFHGDRMREHEQVMVQATQRDMRTWPVGEPVRVQQGMRRITMEVILRAVFGVEAERMNPMRVAIVELLEPPRLQALQRRRMSRPGQARPIGPMGRALDRLDALIYEEIAHRRAADDVEQRPDILSLLLQARDENGEPMSDAELRDELVTLLLAGHETTAATAAWAIERLVRHPPQLRRLMAEIDAGESDEYLTAVVNETLRVRPVAPLAARKLLQDLQVGRYLLPEGTHAAVSMYLTNRNPNAYEDPDAFRPERFLESSPETFSWVPFGGGIRRCVGAAFATLETKMILRTVLRELEPKLPRTLLTRRGEAVAWPNFVFAPMRGARVVWQRRTGA